MRDDRYVPAKKSATLSVQARTGARRREATQAEILDATRRLLQSGESFAGLSMERIAKEAGMSRATLYLHFSDKKDIIARLGDGIVEQRFSLGAELLADPSIGREVVVGIVTQMVDRWIDDARLLDAIIQLAEEDEQMREAWTRAIHEVGAMGADLMRRRWGDGPSSAPDPETIGQVLAWMFERSAHQLTRDPSRRDQVIAAVAEVVWRVFDYVPHSPES